MGVNSYCDRFLTADWAQASRATFVRRLLLVFAWRLVTLAAAAIVLAGLMPWIGAALGWAGLAIAPGLMLAYVLCEGLFRFLEIVLTATLQQVACQALLFARGLGRFVLVALMLVDPLTALDVLWVDILVTAGCCVIAMVVVVRMAIGLPIERVTEALALFGIAQAIVRGLIAPRHYALCDPVQERASVLRFSPQVLQAFAIDITLRASCQENLQRGGEIAVRLINNPAQIKGGLGVPVIPAGHLVPHRRRLTTQP
jgi:hypothetical protein